MPIRKLCAVVFLYLSLSMQAQAVTFKSALGSGTQYGGILGWQGSLIYDANKVRLSFGYAGFAWGYDRYLGSNKSLGVQVFSNQYRIGTGLSLNYYFSPHESSGWIIGLDLYRAYETDEFAFEFFRDIFLNPENVDIDAEVNNGVFLSVGYQF